MRLECHINMGDLIIRRFQEFLVRLGNMGGLMGKVVKIRGGNQVLKVLLRESNNLAKQVQVFNIKVQEHTIHLSLVFQALHGNTVDRTIRVKVGNNLKDNQVEISLLRDLLREDLIQGFNIKAQEIIIQHFPAFRAHLGNTVDRIIKVKVAKVILVVETNHKVLPQMDKVVRVFNIKDLIIPHSLEYQAHLGNTVDLTIRVRKVKVRLDRVNLRVSLHKVLRRVVQIQVFNTKAQVLIIPHSLESPAHLGNMVDHIIRVKIKVDKDLTLKILPQIRDIHLPVSKVLIRVLILPLTLQFLLTLTTVPIISVRVAQTSKGLTIKLAQILALL